jgi:hypothetical protein
MGRHATRMRENRRVYIILLWKLNGRHHLGEQGIDGWTVNIFFRNMKRVDWLQSAWCRFIVYVCEHGNEPSASIRSGDFLDLQSLFRLDVVLHSCRTSLYAVDVGSPVTRSLLFLCPVCFTHRCSSVHAFFVHRDSTSAGKLHLSPCMNFKRPTLPTGPKFLARFLRSLLSLTK